MYQLLGHCSGVMDQILPKGPKVIFSRCSKIQFAFSEWLRLVKNQSPGSLRQYLTTNVLWGEFQRITAVQTVNHGLFWITSFPACQCPHRTDHLPPFSNWKELFWMKIWKELDMMLRSKFEPEGLFQTWETVSWGSGRSRDGTAPSLQKKIQQIQHLIFDHVDHQSPHGWWDQHCPRPCRRATCGRTWKSPSESWPVRSVRRHLHFEN